ncbi:MAG: hypothetical protein GY861_01135 [bacterium]|nr:hypothetical protein [bacterium]
MTNENNNKDNNLNNITESKLSSKELKTLNKDSNIDNLNHNSSNNNKLSDSTIDKIKEVHSLIEQGFDKYEIKKKVYISWKMSDSRIYTIIKMAFDQFYKKFKRSKQQAKEFYIENYFIIAKKAIKQKKYVAAIKALENMSELEGMLEARNKFIVEKLKSIEGLSDIELNKLIGEANKVRTTNNNEKGKENATTNEIN